MMAGPALGAVGGVGLGVVLALWGVSPQAGAPVASAPASVGRVAIVADDWPPMNALAKFLREEGCRDVRCVEQKLLPEKLSDCQAVFMYIHGRMTQPTEKALIDYATSGGRLIILHHGIASARRSNAAWLKLTGIHIARRDNPKYPWKVLGNTTHTLVNLRPGHYITTHRVRYDRVVDYLSSDCPSRPARLPAIDLKNTEVFLNQHFTDGRAKTVLFGFRAETADGKVVMQDRSGWYKPAGKGWVFYLQPGHCVSDFQNRGYCQVILNCLTWRAGA